MSEICNCPLKMYVCVCVIFALSCRAFCQRASIWLFLLFDLCDCWHFMIFSLTFFVLVHSWKATTLCFWRIQPTEHPGLPFPSIQSNIGIFSVSTLFGRNTCNYVVEILFIMWSEYFLSRGQETSDNILQISHSDLIHVSSLRQQACLKGDRSVFFSAWVVRVPTDLVVYLT